MMVSLRPVLLLLSLAASSAALSAQEPAAQKQPLPPKSITLDVIVTPKNGRPVEGLEKSDFTLFDNKVPQAVTSFRTANSSDSPVEVLMVIDTVNINYTRLTYERQQIDNFLRSNGGHLAHPTSIAIFADTGIQVQQGFSTDGNLLSQTLKKAIIGLREINESAGFYGDEDQIDLSLRALHSLVQREQALPGRKIMVWISPGWPYLSGPEIDLTNKQEEGLFQEVVGISRQLREANVTLYAVNPRGAGQSVGWEFYYEEFLKGVTKPYQTQLGNLALQVIAIQSGGLAFNASNDTVGRLQQCIDDTKSWYEITYTPPKADRPDEYHQIEVKVDKPGLTAHTRTGYYDQP